MGSHTGFGSFADFLLQKVKQALDYLDEPSVQRCTKKVGDRRSSSGSSHPSYSSNSSHSYSYSFDYDSDLDEDATLYGSPNRSLLKVLLYWLYNSYFQPLDDDSVKSKRGCRSISLIQEEEGNDVALKELEQALEVGDKFWLQVGHIQLPEVMTYAFAKQGWSIEELKGYTVLFQLQVEFVGVDNNTEDPYSRLLFSYQPDTFKLSPYLFLFSPNYLNERTKSANLTFDTILQHRELCDSKNLNTKKYVIDEKGTTGLCFTLEGLYEQSDMYLHELGWDNLIKKGGEIGANQLYIVDFHKIYDSDQVLTWDFYLDDLMHIFKESLQNPGYSGVLQPMAEALFDPAISTESWYSDRHMRKWLSLRYYSSARWPSPYSPALMQQVAINLATKASSPKIQPVFSVNGPPGTGKTTLLKDIIAQKVFERAKLIADMKGECFEEAILFQAKSNQKVEDFSITPLKSEFRSCNLLVASCNNAAVENLTRELPDRANMPKTDDLKGGVPMSVDYFSASATQLLQSLRGDKSEAWGLIAVPMGKRQNIEVFVETWKDCLSKDLEAAGSGDPHAQLQQAISEFNRSVQRVGTLCASLEQKDGNLTDFSSDKAQIGNPFHDDAFNRAREQLFYASLEVLKRFNALPVMIDNLKASLLYLDKKKLYSSFLVYPASEGDKEIPVPLEDFAPHAFDMLFSLVPVISTTFASVSTMFCDVKEPGRLGCLIVDEAGQAAPHMAAGALWRASQTIVVGDPKQVEPVVKTDAIVKRYTRALLQLAKVEFFDEEISLQTMADVTNPYGGYIGDPIPRNWVGCPLRVHRRCCEPMFSISNRTSYSGTMILGGNAVLPPDKAQKMLLAKSGWWNVSGKVFKNSHYVKDQGKAALELVQEWMNRWVDTAEKERPKLFVISPFKSVVEDFKTEVIAYLKTNQQLRKAFGTWPHSCIGTVHTFQGKEAEEVIFLLGCDAKKVSSAQWVNSNILNVAVTRAKCRVYFIGDWAVWKQNKIFAKNIVFGPADSEGEPLVKFTSREELPQLPEPQMTDEELLDDLGVTPYLKWSVLTSVDEMECCVFIQDMERGWIFRIEFFACFDFPLESYRISKYYFSDLGMSGHCALVYPIRIKEDPETVRQALLEACQFLEEYLRY